MQACLTIPKYKKSAIKPINDSRLLEGTYSNFNNNGINHRTAFQLINWKANKINNADTTNFSTFNIRILNDRTLSFNFSNSLGRTETKKVKFRVQDNGFFILRNHNFRLIGIPYILGYYDIKKMEIGLTEKNELIINGVEKGEGAILIVLGSGYPKTNFSLTYEKK
ncbi:hypothetical protein A5893_13825 [Pedobacter psychrophilus]|uniref:Uncharacterized protein n=2 Tax=Pedobacter psychrophilus TaxID=1826909 RepID=A0A179DD88_9SPHI|nr:hypothetical protein A5893_13825 [Pedobacter psychrophilus]